MVSCLPEDILTSILGAGSPLDMVKASAVCTQFYEMYHAAHRPIELHRGVDVEARLCDASEGSTVYIYGEHDVDAKDIVVRSCLQIIGRQNARLHLRGGSRILWCAVGRIFNVNISRELDLYDSSPQYPDGILCVRGCGRLRVCSSSLRYTARSLRFVAFGVHVDFGAAIFLKSVNFTDIPGPCIKVINGRVEVDRGVFISVREYPIIIASRGFVRVVACTTLCRPVISRRVHILLRDGASADTSSSPHWVCRRQ